MGTVRSTSLINITHFHLPCIAAVSSYHGEIGLRIRSKLSPPRLLGASVLSEHISSQFAFSILCAVGFSSSFDAPTSDKITRFSLRCGIVISHCGAIFYVTFAQHVLPTHLVSCSLSYTYTHSSGLRHEFEVKILLTFFCRFDLFHYASYVTRFTLGYIYSFIDLQL